MAFSLHTQLAHDCEAVADLELCSLLLMRDHRFPWTVLVPRIDGLRDLHDLPTGKAPLLFAEIRAVSRALTAEFDAHKINVAALGNQVPQLHVHVIARFTDDAAWPGPVWNAGLVLEVDEDVVRRRLAALRKRFH